MKKLRKILPAFGMLMLAACLLSTSSFAWFSMNTQVTATGMQVQAAAGGDLLISKTSATTGFATTVDLSVTDDGNGSTKKDNLVPASTSTTLTNGAPTFYILDKKGTGMQADNYAAGTGAEFTVDTSNYWTDRVWVMSSVNAKNLTATITIPVNEGVAAGGTHALDPSLRMMLVVKSADASTAYIYAPTNTSDPAYKAVTSATGVAEGAENVKITKSGSVIIEGEITANTAYQIDIYIWYEGQDVNCKSSNAFNLTSTTFDIAFSVTAEDEPETT